MNLQTDDLELLVRVVERGSLSAAARERDLPVSQVTRSIQRLEAQAGARLLNRSTHGLSLTDEGDTFLAHARRMLDERDAFANEIGARRQGPSGWVRVSVSPLLAQMVIAPSLPELHARHPGIRLDIHADDRLSDLVRDGIDVAIRTGDPAGDSLVARQIADYARRLYAAPAYLARHGTPRSIEDLAGHRLLANSANPWLNRWPLAAPIGPRRVREWVVDGHTRIDNSAVLLSLVEHGAGIGRLTDLLARPLERTGALVPLLDGVMPSSRVPIYAVMPRARERLPKIRACIDFWTEWLAELARPA